MLELNKLSDEEVRKMIFDWCESTERCDDVDTTVFVYEQSDINSHKALGLQIFKEIQ